MNSEWEIQKSLKQRIEDGKFETKDVSGGWIKKDLPNDRVGFLYIPPIKGNPEMISFPAKIKME